MAESSESSDDVLPFRIEGWLNVWEVESHFADPLSTNGRRQVPVWEPYFCVLHQATSKLVHNRNEKDGPERPPSDDKAVNVERLDGSKAEFDKRWGYETLQSIKENAIQHFPFEWGKDRIFSSFPRKFTFKSASLDVFSSRSQTLDNRSSATKDSAYEKGLGERRGSVPVVSTSPIADENMEPPSTPSRLASFFSKRVIKSNLKRTKSVTKLDRKRTLNNDSDGSQSPSTRPKLVSSLRRTMSLGRLARKWNPRLPPGSQNGDDGSGEIPAEKNLHHHYTGPCQCSVWNEESQRTWALINSRMRTSRSHESLLMTHSAMHSIDLTAPDVEIKPLHSSILGQDHCFQVSTTNGSKYYSCRSAHERQKWIQSLRKTVMPNQEQTVRTENSLKLWVLEAKNCITKKRYFCELCLDKTLYARTSTKQKNEMLFWGEQFDFNNIPPVELITVNLYREADKKKKKDKNVLVGYVHICVSEINGRQLTERWYSASSATVGKAGKENKGELPLIRIKARYQTVNILPMDLYTSLINFMETDTQLLVEVLEPLISVKAKEELANTMVHTLQRLGVATQLLPDIVMAEVDKIDNENLTFRGNSIATKAMEAYMKLVGEKYIQDTLGDFIRTVLESSEDCEVDPTRVPNNLTLQRHQKNLVMYCEMVWFKIINSYCFFPRELRIVFSALASRCADRKRPDVADHLVSACVFLRFFCPAILSPSLFNLTQEYPQERAARNLTLIAKTIQNLANFTKFGSKEEYMTFMNDFVDREFESMKTFTQQISQDPDVKCVAEEFDGYVDLGKQLSVLHTILGESLEKMNEGADVKLGRLKQVLGDLTTAEENPQGTLQKLKLSTQTNSMHLYDNVSSDDSPRSQTPPQLPPHGDTNANTNNTNRLLSNLKKDYRDAELSRSQDLPIVPNHLMEPKPLPIERPYRTLGCRMASRPPLEAHRSGFDDYVLFSPLDNHAATNHNVAQVRTMPRSERLNEQQVNHSWNKMVTAADLVNGQDYIDLISFMDESHSDGVQNSSAELDNGSQVSIGQLSTVASSGYQSFGYSQSSSPVDSVVQPEGSVQPINGQPLSFSNPLFQHQNHGSPTQTLLPAGSVGNGASSRTLLADLPRVMSSSSLSSEDGTLSTNSRRSARKTHNLSSQNGGSTHIICPSLKADQENALRKMSNLSCSSSSSESLGVSATERERRTMVVRNGQQQQSPVHHRRTAPYSHLSHSHSLDSRCNVAFDISPLDQDADSGPLTIGELSRSAELPRFVPSASPQQQRMRRTHTADAILSPQAHSSNRGQHQHCGYARRQATPQNTVRMGVRSVQQRHQVEQEKHKTDYEAELTLLRQQLAETQAMLLETQRRLNLHDTPDSDDWSSQLRLEDARRDKIDKDTQMKGIIKRLITVEEARRHEQQHLQSIVDEKQHIIETQERRLMALDMANGRLMSAINQIKEQTQQRHGNKTGLPPPAVLSLAESGQFRTSSC